MGLLDLFLSPFKNDTSGTLLCYIHTYPKHEINTTHNTPRHFGTTRAKSKANMACGQHQPGALVFVIGVAGLLALHKSDDSVA